MTIAIALRRAYTKLGHLESAHLDAEILLAHILQKPREYLLAHPEQSMSDHAYRRFLELIEKRAHRVPVAYLTNTKEFYGRDFYIDERAHIPRPATEDLIHYIKKSIAPDFNGIIADIGTGSGCIAITLAIEYPKAVVIATDISRDALAVAQKNAAAHSVSDQIDFRQGDLFEPLDGKIDVIICNPPYGWKNGWSDDPEVAAQPDISNYSGADGLRMIRRFLAELPNHMQKNGSAYLKFDPRRVSDVCALLDDSALAYTLKKDLAGFHRIALMTNYS